MQNFRLRLRSRVEGASSYFRILQTPVDFAKLLELKVRARAGSTSGKARSLRLRSLGGKSVVCRPLQSDTYTLGTTFLENFHLPPVTLPSHPVIVDLGSNVGYTVADLAHRYPMARILGVEMDHENAQLARHNTSWCGERVSIEHAAVWVEDGFVNYEGRDADAYAIISNRSNGSARAPARQLTSLLSEHQIGRVDYLKMDIEGAESFVLSQQAQWLDVVQSMKIEIHPPASFEWCRELLERRGFCCWKDDRHHNALCAVRFPHEKNCVGARASESLLSSESLKGET